jgi:outer membrane protein TolC
MLSLCVLCCIPAPVFAASSYDVSVNTIDGIVSGASNYSRAAVSQLSAAQTDYNNAVVKINSTNAKINASTDPDETAALKEELADLIKERDAAALNIQQVSLDNSLTLVQQGESAKEQYLKYLESLSSKKSLLVSIDVKKNSVSIARKKYKKGMISRNDLTKAKEALEDLQDQVPDADYEIQQEYNALIDSLGVADDSTLNVQPLSGEDKAAFAAAKYYSFTTDMNSVLANSLEIKKANAKVNALRSTGGTDYSNALSDLDTLMTKTRKSFRDQYDSLQHSIASMKSYDRKTARAKSAMKQAKKKYHYGLISRNEYTASVNAYKEAKTNGEKAITSLYPTIMKYQLAVKGY